MDQDKQSAMLKAFAAEVSERQRKGLKQLAGKAGIHPGSLLAYGRGASLPRLDRFLQLCAAFGMAPNQLLAWPDKAEPPAGLSPSELQELADQLRQVARKLTADQNS